MLREVGRGDREVKSVNFGDGLPAFSFQCSLPLAGRLTLAKLSSFASVSLSLQWG